MIFYSFSYIELNNKVQTCKGTWPHDTIIFGKRFKEKFLKPYVSLLKNNF